MTVTARRVLSVLLAVLMVASMPAAGAHAGGATAASDDALATSEAVVQAANDDVSVEIESVAGTAGGASTPSSVSTFVRIDEGDDPYDGAVDPADLTVTVGSETVSANTITTSRVRPGHFLLTFGPPAQSNAGHYDMTVEFEGSSDTWDDAIVYSQTEASVIAASLQMDRSGSMRDIMDEAIQAGLSFVEQADDDDYVSLTSYSDSATVDQELGQLGDDRQAIVDGIGDLDDGGGTNSGDAMREGLDTLDDAPDGTVKAGIHMTDGNLNEGPTEREVLNEIVPEYNQRGVCLYTIGFTDGADEDFMQEVADAADCGFYQFAAESGEADAAEETLQEVFEDMQTDVSGDSTISEDSGQVAGGDTVTETVSVDESVRQATVNIQFEGVDLSGVSTQALSVAPLSTDQDHVTLYDPDGNAVDANDTDVDVSVVEDTVIYRIDSPQPGEWTYELQNPDQTDREYSATVTGFAQTNLELVTNADTYYEGTETNVIATLTGQDEPIDGATVEGELTLPDGSVETVTLSQADNGVYTTSIDVEESGTYELTALASKDDLSRAETLEWEVQAGQPVAIEQVQTVEIDQGDGAAIDVTLERDGGSSSQEVIVGIEALEQVDGSGAIGTDRLTVQNQTVELAPDETETVRLDADIPRDAPYGTYEGEVEAYLEDGSVLDGSVNATIEIDREPADYAGPSATVDVDGLLDAVDEFRNGVIDVDHLLDVIDAFATDATVA